MNPSNVSPLILTVGHSTRTLEEFLRLLESNKVEIIVDVRTIPRSRRNPQFNQDTLPGSLQMTRIAYVHLKDLGGLRHPKADSPNTGWRNLSFRGFADYMQTPEFDSGLEKLIIIARQGQTAVMCAEALPWRCHRWLIADALLVRGIQAEHIMTEKTRKTHTLTEWAHVEGKQITYPPTQTQLLKTA